MRDDGASEDVDYDQAEEAGLWLALPEQGRGGCAMIHNSISFFCKDLLVLNACTFARISKFSFAEIHRFRGDWQI